jgi:hypothetical protein
MLERAALAAHLSAVLTPLPLGSTYRSTDGGEGSYTGIVWMCERVTFIPYELSRLCA